MEAIVTPLAWDDLRRPAERSALIFVSFLHAFTGPMVRSSLVRLYPRESFRHCDDRVLADFRPTVQAGICRSGFKVGAARCTGPARRHWSATCLADERGKVIPNGAAAFLD